MHLGMQPMSVIDDILGLLALQHGRVSLELLQQPVNHLQWITAIRTVGDRGGAGVARGDRPGITAANNNAAINSGSGSGVNRLSGFRPADS